MSLLLARRGVLAAGVEPLLPSASSASVLHYAETLAGNPTTDPPDPDASGSSLLDYAEQLAGG